MIDLTPYTDSNGDIYLKKELIQKLAGIVTSGSNHNGSYIRFSDGTQMCWGSVGKDTTEWTWTLPADFSERPPRVFAFPTANSTIWQASKTVTTVTIGTSVSTYIQALAIGRWK